VGQVLWSIDAYKADDVQPVKALYLIGARPVRDSIGRVVSVELIPLEELGKPRIDGCEDKQYCEGHLTKLHILN
jgi:magnesium chelatase subunit H